MYSGAPLLIRSTHSHLSSLVRQPQPSTYPCMQLTPLILQLWPCCDVWLTHTYMEHCRKVLLFNSAHAWMWEIRQELTLSLLHLSSLWLLPPSYYSINYMQFRLLCTLRKHNKMQLHSYSKLYSNSHIKIIIILCIYVYTNSHINAIH